jgi:hypothetical protein
VLESIKHPCFHKLCQNFASGENYLEIRHLDTSLTNKHNKDKNNPKKVYNKYSGCSGSLSEGGNASIDL